MIRVGIIGYGNMGSKYAQLFIEGRIENAELRAVSTSKKNEVRFSEDISVFDHHTKMFQSGKIDAVIITAPHIYHPQMAIEAFKAGIHVLTEKPAGIDIKNVRIMNDAAVKSSLKFGIIFNQRMKPIFRKLKEIMDSGEMGEMKRTSWIITDWYRTDAYYKSSQWRGTWKNEGGGVLINQCPHNLDLWQWICGMPNKVTGFCREGRWHDIEVEDDVTAYFEYPNGATGVFITSTGDFPGTNRLEISLDRGKIVLEDGKIMKYKMNISEREFNKTNNEAWAKPEFTVEEVVVSGVDTAYVGLINNFISAIINNEEIIASGTEGINSLMISNAIMLSSWTDKTVEIPFDEDLFLETLKNKS